jgi:hypothetical protein
MSGPRTLAWISIFSIFLTGFGSCSRTLEVACSRHFPKVEREIADASSSLSTQGARVLASLDESTRRAQAKWAFGLLEETQAYIDLMLEDQSHSKARKELQMVANELVALHGFYEQGKARRAADSLEKIRKHSTKARALACKR